MMKLNIRNMWPPGYSISILQVFIICKVFTSKGLHFLVPSLDCTEDAGGIHYTFAINGNKSTMNVTGSNIFHLQKTNKTLQLAGEEFSIGTAMVRAISVLTT